MKPSSRGLPGAFEMLEGRNWGCWDPAPVPSPLLSTCKLITAARPSQRGVPFGDGAESAALLGMRRRGSPPRVPSSPPLPARPHPPPGTTGALPASHRPMSPKCSPRQPPALCRVSGMAHGTVTTSSNTFEAVSLISLSETLFGRLGISSLPAKTPFPRQRQEPALGVRP